MTSYLAATLARVRVPGLARQPARGPRAAGACGGATRRVACDGRKRARRRGPHYVSGASCSRTEVLTRDHGSPPTTPAYVRRQTPRDRAAAIEVLRTAVELGVNHIDTADAYGPHITNEIIRKRSSRTATMCTS